MARNPFNIPRIISAVDFAIKDALAIAARDAVLHFKKSFDDEGFTDEGYSRWEKRKNYSRRGKSGSGSPIRSVKKYRKILTLTGKLKRSITIKLFSATKALIGTDSPYAAIHNQGLMGKAWGKHSFKMPKRQFIGNSRKLERRTLAKITAKVSTAIRNAI
jgi:phage gpG-like protein